MTAPKLALTLAAIHSVDELVRSSATYVHDADLRDTWTSYAKEVMAGGSFEGDCDDWAQTAIHILWLQGAPKNRLYRALVSSTGGPIDHMIGLVELDTGEMWSIADTFGPPQRVQGHRVGPHLIVQTARVSEGKKFRNWAGRRMKRTTTSACMDMRMSPEGRAFVRGHEKFVAIPYDDFRPRYTLRPGDPIRGTLTGGFGHTGPDVKLGVKVSRAVGEAWFEKDLARFEAAVRKLVRVELAQHQFDALVSFAFNCGEGNLKTSTLLKKVNARAPEHEIQAQFRRWTRSKGVVLAGLVKRRDMEAAMWAGDVVTHGALQPMFCAAEISPQPTVDEDRSARKSPDVWLAGGATGVGGLSIWTAIQEALRDFRDTLADSDMTLVMSICGVVMAIIGAVLLYKRLREIWSARR